MKKIFSFVVPGVKGRNKEDCMYVNNTDINFSEIGITMFQVVDYFLENKKVPEDLKDIRRKG